MCVFFFNINRFPFLTEGHWTFVLWSLLFSDSDSFCFISLGFSISVLGSICVAKLNKNANKNRSTGMGMCFNIFYAKWNNMRMFLFIKAAIYCCPQRHIVVVPPATLLLSNAKPKQKKKNSQKWWNKMQVQSISPVWVVGIGIGIWLWIWIGYIYECGFRLVYGFSAPLFCLALWTAINQIFSSLSLSVFPS